LEGDAVDHFERRVSLRWVILFVLVMVSLLGVGWAYSMRLLAQERATQEAEEAARAEAAKQLADQARRNATEKVAPIPQRHFLEKGKSYLFWWQTRNVNAVVTEEPRDNWVKVRAEGADQWINLSNVHGVMVASEAKGGKDADKGAGEATAPVEGKVTFNGKPVEKGKVIFHPEKGNPVEADIKDGQYTAKGVPVGTLTVTVTAEGLPEKYARKNQTPIRFECSKGVNEADFILMR
jgi:hypothetical protein